MTSTVWKKLNLTDKRQVAVVNAPESFEAEINDLSKVKVVRDLASIAGLSFIIAFVIQRQEIKKISNTLTKMAAGDITVWFAYPKGSSKRCKCDFNHNTGWDPLGVAGLKGVRQVAIDEDWSALRFRGVEYIKKIKSNIQNLLSLRRVRPNR